MVAPYLSSHWLTQPASASQSLGVVSHADDDAAQPSRIFLFSQIGHTRTEKDELA